MSRFGGVGSQLGRRRLHGRRGLKFCVALSSGLTVAGRRLHGRRGLKSNRQRGHVLQPSRRLHGRRGLKLRLRRELLALSKSPPSRAAWIEIG